MPRRIDLNAWQNRLSEPCLSMLLVIEALTIFAVGPLVAIGRLQPWSSDVCLLLMAFVSIWIARKRYHRVLVILGFFSMLAGSIFKPPGGYQQTPAYLALFSVIFFVSVITFVVAQKVFSGGPITLHRIQGAIIIYLNIALLFGVVFNAILFIAPHAYSGISGIAQNQLGEMIYFSMTTLTTTGYGDLVPVDPIARSLANLESVIGQLYPSTLMATLIGLHVTHRQHNDIS